MNVEKTMEFILQQQARAEVQMAAMREQQARAEKRQDKTDQQLAKTERQIAAIQKLIVAGMKMIVKQGTSIKQLTEAQKVTEIKLQVLIDALRRGGNGSGRRH